MSKNIADRILDRATTADFWRGIVYAVSGLGIAMDPQAVEAIVAGALMFSGLVHAIWHKPKNTNAK